MKKLLFLSLFCFSGSFVAFAQSPSADAIEITKIIQDVFDGMRESDTSNMAPYMHPNVQMQSFSVDEKGNQLSQLSGPARWLQAVAQNADAVWNEQIENLEILSDGAIASAWMDYKFYLGNELSHCGTNSFQFIKVDGKWKIIYIIDSRKTNGCN